MLVSPTGVPSNTSNGSLYEGPERLSSLSHWCMKSRFRMIWMVYSRTTYASLHESFVEIYLQQLTADLDAKVLGMHFQLVLALHEGLANSFRSAASKRCSLGYPRNQLAY
ncbi:hypothetical protein ABVK25_003636 [Lepraria finkii]|uniref:Uncharacterized protein n=1 Tax=Lepraria finkii TaxID=1340010 RepID=A0ABR4BDR5_9LECA